MSLWSLLALVYRGKFTNQYRVSHQLEAAVWAEEWNGWLTALCQRQLGNQLQTGVCLKLGARVSCTSLTARLQGSEDQEADSSTACASWIL